MANFNAGTVSLMSNKSSLLFKYVKEENFASLEPMLREGKRIKDYINNKDGEGHTALYYAVKQNNDTIINLLYNK